MGCYKLTYLENQSSLFVSSSNFRGCEKERGNKYDLDYRNYDPVLGRMNGVDPMASKYASHTPYNFAFNDPVYWNDPTGADPLYNETTRAAFGETMQGGYFKPHIMDNGVFGRPGGPTESLSYAKVGGMTGAQYSQMHEAARDVRNGTMSSGDYAAANGATEVYWGYGQMPNLETGNGNGNIYLYLYEPISGKSSISLYAQAPLQSSPNPGSLWISSGQNALDILGTLSGAAQGLVVSGDRWVGSNGKYYSNSWGGNQYTGSRSGAFKAARTYGTVGRVALAGTIVLGGISIYNGYQADGTQFGYNTQYAVASTTGGLVGGWAGAEGGAAVGAAIGVWFGGVGAIPGAVIGGIIGGIGGGLLGSSIGENSVDYYHGK